MKGGKRKKEMTEKGLCPGVYEGKGVPGRCAWTGASGGAESATATPYHKGQAQEEEYMTILFYISYSYINIHVSKSGN